MKKTTFLIIGVGVLLVLAVVVLNLPKKEEKKLEPVACTTEAKICPDGTAVGRIGPNCEFAECPTAKPQVKEVFFQCAGDKSIQAKFYPQNDQRVDLFLSDGRVLQLPRAISASGARYANEDESVVFWNKGDTAFITENDKTTFANCILENSEKSEQGGAMPGAVGMANPASKNCTAKGGTLTMRQNKLGQYAVCLFEDNRQCEEWALLRGQCPVGGLKITGYENEAQAYCAITGGTVEGLGTESVLCKRVDGTLCEIMANFNGECPDPNNPEPNAGNKETY